MITISLFVEWSQYQNLDGGSKEFQVLLGPSIIVHNISAAAFPHCYLPDLAVNRTFCPRTASRHFKKVLYSLYLYVLQFLVLIECQHLNSLQGFVVFQNRTRYLCIAE